MIKSGELWEYVTVYADEISFVVQDPAQLVKDPDDSYTYTLKGTRSISLYLGCVGR